MSKQPDAAEAELRQVLAAHRILHDAPHRDIATTLGHLANLASDRGDYDGAVEIWREARSEAIAALGEDHPWITMLELPIARSLLLGGHREEGRRILQRLAALKDPGGQSCRSGGGCAGQVRRAALMSRVPASPA